jgi:uncharacterized protein (DUF1684 family)
MRPRHIHFFLFAILGILFSLSCQRQRAATVYQSTEDSLRIVRGILQHRAEVDSFFQLSDESPFRRDTSTRYHGIKWFAPDLRYYFRSELNRFERAETVSVFGTKGGERRQLRYGYFILQFDGRPYRLNVYKFLPSQAKQSGMNGHTLTVWFTDETTGKETYDVGRYLDVGKEQEDENAIYTIDFNIAHNPYCAYSSHYSCAIPRNEDHLFFPARAGEMKYHE